MIPFFCGVVVGVCLGVVLVSLLRVGAALDEIEERWETIESESVLDASGKAGQADTEQDN